MMSSILEALFVERSRIEIDLSFSQSLANHEVPPGSDF